MAGISTPRFMCLLVLDYFLEAVWFAVIARNADPFALFLSGGFEARFEHILYIPAAAVAFFFSRQGITWLRFEGAVHGRAGQPRGGVSQPSMSVLKAKAIGELYSWHRRFGVCKKCSCLLCSNIYHIGEHGDSIYCTYRVCSKRIKP